MRKPSLQLDSITKLLFRLFIFCEKDNTELEEKHTVLKSFFYFIFEHLFFELEHQYCFSREKQQNVQWKTTLYCTQLILDKDPLIREVTYHDTVNCGERANQTTHMKNGNLESVSLNSSVF